jgi:hypothetical protein
VVEEEHSVADETKRAADELSVALVCWNIDPKILPLLIFSPEDSAVE